MDESRIEERLARAEHAVAGGKPLKGTGFWPAVRAVRADRDLAARFAKQIADIDRRAFERAIRTRTSLRQGLRLLVVATTIGTGLAIVATVTTGATQTAALLAAWAVLSLSTHTLAHWAVGRRFGIEFTHLFIPPLPDPFPGLKIDYATYLPVPPRSRALMHSAGATVSKIIPFALAVLGAAANASSLAIRILLIIGTASVLMDIAGIWIMGDWKKVRRELASARTWRGDAAR